MSVSLIFFANFGSISEITPRYRNFSYISFFSFLTTNTNFIRNWRICFSFIFRCKIFTTSLIFKNFTCPNAGNIILTNKEYKNKNCLWLLNVNTFILHYLHQRATHQCRAEFSFPMKFTLAAKCTQSAAKCTQSAELEYIFQMILLYI